jgi:glycosyltransferase involved in cell wall biosynthesis
MKARTCVLLTSTFPSKGEVFLRYEIPFLAAKFSKVDIISTANRNSARTSSEDYRLLEEFPNVRYLGDVSTLAPTLANIPLILCKSFVTDLPYAFGSVTSLKKHLYRFVMAVRVRKFLETAYSDDGNVVFYSYWLNAGAVALALLSHKRNITIARAHGSDIYDDNVKTGYNTFTSLCARALDRVYCVSEHGRDYIVQKTGQQDKVLVSRLGVPIAEPQTHAQLRSGGGKFEGKLRLVSCSTVDANKRVHLILATLPHLNTTLVEWTHIGSGPFLSDIKATADRLPDHIETKFLGSLDNQEIHKHLKSHNYDIFLNTSLSEGVPVSAMEAMSYGIPCIATDVGGTGELVRGGGGQLVPVDITAEQLAEVIRSFWLSTDRGTNNRAAEAKAKIAEDYSSRKNFSRFAGDLINFTKNM